MRHNTGMKFESIIKSSDQKGTGKGDSDNPSLEGHNLRTKYKKEGTGKSNRGTSRIGEGEEESNDEWRNVMSKKKKNGNKGKKESVINKRNV